MGRMFYFWGKLYKGLIGHLIFVWITMLIFGSAILGIYFGEQKIEKRANQHLSASPLILYLSQNIDTKKLISELKRYNLIQKIYLKTGSESLSALQKKFGLTDLQNWVSADELSDFLTIHFDGSSFSQPQFQQLLGQLSKDKRIESLDYNTAKIRFWGKIKSLLNQYKIYPILIIILVAAIQLFLVRRLMRVHQKEQWRIWKSKGFKHLYKLPHLLIEIVILLIGLFLGFGIPIYIWQDKLYQILGTRILVPPLGWYGAIGLFVIYVVIGLLNLISKNERV
jgi:hypothetical protein